MSPNISKCLGRRAIPVSNILSLLLDVIKHGKSFTGDFLDARTGKIEEGGHVLFSYQIRKVAERENFIQPRHQLVQQPRIVLS